MRILYTQCRGKIVRIRDLIDVASFLVFNKISIRILYKIL